MKKKMGVVTVVSLLILIFFFKYVIWWIIAGAIIAIVVLACKKISEKNTKIDECIDNTSTALNYTPLTKEEVNRKYSDTPRNDTSKKEYNMDNLIKKRGYVSINNAGFQYDVIEKLMNRYIAFDVETTGLHAYSDRIIEIGAVLFENSIPTKTFNSLVNPKVKISPSVTAINHITNDMIMAAPAEENIYPKLIQFLGDALDNQTIICAHNASFDMNFLSETLSRLGYDAKVSYVDTLSISRSLVRDLENYKQPTVASHFGIVNEQEHRASSDAKVCGMILSKLLEIKKKEQEIIRQKQEEREKEERLKREEFLILQKEFHKKRNEISINPINDRVPFNEICNSNDTDEYYNTGYPFYASGDVLRKSGNIEAAIVLFDKARYNGYNHPCLYRSYAMAYHQIKDYDNEIDILDEGIQRFQQDISICKGLEVRRNKAVTAFIERQEKIKKSEEKKLKLAERDANKAPQKPHGRAVLQLSDDMTLIKQYESIAQAEKETGINCKSIRDAAKGIQKHAGGFVWKYAEDILYNTDPS